LRTLNPSAKLWRPVWGGKRCDNQAPLRML
jgi:hypothetical protein